MVRKILCVAEKPSIAKSVAHHLAGGEANVTARNVPGVVFVKNYEFSFAFGPPWGQSEVIMTSVVGHIKTQDFASNFHSWRSCNPDKLFDAPIVTSVDAKNVPIAKNIETQARFARALYIWTDCDREGEYIGAEIREIALKGNNRLEVKRARFSNIEAEHVRNAARNPVLMDERQVNAVAARIELDLRIGSCFTRMQTLDLKPLIDHVQELKLISYGSCQFPTLGFVVDRYFRVKNFVPEKFWKIQVFHQRDGIKVAFNWQRVHLFDRMVVTILFERCIAAPKAEVTKLEQKPTSKWKPLPLTTVELQKCGSRFLRMDSKKILKVAEDLYTRGFISYPRTETDQFDREIDLRKLIEKQTDARLWGDYARGLLDGNFNQPRAGRNNDQAHPPIHPVNNASSASLNDEERRIYEFVVRRFLACCSEDAKGQSTIAELSYSTEIFTARGLQVLARNYLDVYPYDKWESTQQLPDFTLHETFIPSEAFMNDGETSPPNYLTEPELLALMDANGIGTDATMAEHIATIKARSYVITQGGDVRTPAAGNHNVQGSGRGRGSRGRGRGGRNGRETTVVGGAVSSTQVFIPTTLGVALIAGYDKIGFETSLSKPFLRKEMESQMKAICAGTTSRNDVIQQNLEQYREVYIRSVRHIDVLKNSFRRYVLGNSEGHG